MVNSRLNIINLELLALCYNLTTLKKNGFTLIEITFVAAVMAVIGTIVLFATTSFRNDANDTRVKIILSDMRLKAQDYLAKYGKYWGGSGEGITGFVNRTSGISCSTDGTVFNLTDGIGNDIKNTLDKPSSPWIATCSLGNSSKDSWAVAVVLKNSSISNGQWCVDSSGNAKEVGPTPPSTLGGASTKAQCP